MNGQADWTPRIGWRKASLHLVVRGALSLGLSLGTACLLVRLFHDPTQATDTWQWHVRGFLWAPVGVFPGFVTGVLVSRKLVVSTGLVGSSLALAAASALILAHLGAFALGVAVLGEDWFLRMASFQAGACLFALAIAIRQVLIDS